MSHPVPVRRPPETPLLLGIDHPTQLRRLPESALRQLAEEMREFIIHTVADTGGHLGASLGVVELAIALHYTFETPEDRLIWDVGHQSYPHKILTGRRERMATLRRRNGLSGFTSRAESPFDPFGTGHSSTSISAALGMALAFRMRGTTRRKAIAVIGDGAMTAGMAFEAMNNTGQHSDADLIVILNDNEMSISPNVGALSAYLSRILSGPLYTRFRGGTGRVLSRISEPLREVARKAEGHVKGMLTPGTLFEELGFSYYGPVDGHDFGQLLPTLRNLRQLNGPVLLHVVTRKGRGFAPAEANPCTYHGVPPFDPVTGRMKSSGDGPTYTQIFADSLIELASRESRVVAITAAMPEGTGLHLFQERFPTRFFDVGIAEQHAVTFAAGLATEGLIPVVAIYSTFMQRAFDQVVHDVALQQLPVVLALDRAGLVGADGPTHAGAYDLTFLRAVPNLVLMAPADGAELRRMVATALTLHRPVMVRYPRGVAPEGLSPGTTDPFAPLPVGVGRKLRSGGPTPAAAVVAVGTMVPVALAAATLLAAEEVELSVYDARFIKPLDGQLLREAASHPVLVTIEENTVLGGFGSAVLEFLAGEGLLDRGLRVRILGLPDRFVPHGRHEGLLAELGLDAAGVATVIRALIAGKA